MLLERFARIAVLQQALLEPSLFTSRGLGVLAVVRKRRKKSACSLRVRWRERISRVGLRTTRCGEATATVTVTMNQVVVEGTITDVCAKKGCWMKVVDGDDEIFVKFRDYGFFVPRNAADHRDQNESDHA